MSNNPQFTIRPIQSDDAIAIHALSKSAKSGLSSLPKSIQQAETICKKASESFKGTKKNKSFLFALQNSNNEVIGVSGIKSNVGTSRPYYSFELKNSHRFPYLELLSISNGPSEIGSLFLLPEYRNQGVGRLLSLSRFLFIKCFESFFSSTIIAELRGYLNDNNESPFWNHLGKKFIPMSFDEADRLSIEDETFISKQFPKHPIYLTMLPKIAMNCLGKVHDMTRPAKQLLLSEHFNVTNHFDIFDGGPKLECQTKKIRSIVESKTIQASCIEHLLSDEYHLISNCKQDHFRCVRANKETPINGIFKALLINNTDTVCVIKERP